MTQFPGSARPRQSGRGAFGRVPVPSTSSGLRVTLLTERLGHNVFGFECSGTVAELAAV
jgi:hypothetical protein